MKCPVDGCELEHQSYESAIEIDKCPGCGGIWLDHRELARIQDTRERDYSAEIRQIPNLVGQAYAMALARPKPTVHCPACQQALERREHGGCSQVLIDTCPRCQGIWLDEGELRALEIFFEKAATDTAEMRLGFLTSLRNLFGR